MHPWLPRFFRGGRNLKPVRFNGCGPADLSQSADNFPSSPHKPTVASHTADTRSCFCLMATRVAWVVFGHMATMLEYFDVLIVRQRTIHEIAKEFLS